MNRLNKFINLFLLKTKWYVQDIFIERYCQDFQFIINFTFVFLSIVGLYSVTGSQPDYDTASICYTIQMFQIIVASF